MKINYLNALAGAGKTFQAIENYAVEEARRGERILVAMPTKALIEEQIAKLANAGITVTQIVASEQPKGDEESVASRLLHKLRQPDASGQIVLITHEGLKMLRYSGTLDWHLIIDEAPQVHYAFDLMIDEEILRLINATERSPSLWKGLTEFNLRKDPAKVLDIPKDVTKRRPVHKLAWALRTDHTDVFVPDSAIEALMVSDPSGKKLAAFSLVRPKLVEPFNSTLILSANFHNTLTYHLWHLLGVKFIEERELGANLRFQEHDGSRATIHYVMDKPWSSAMQKKRNCADGPTVHAHIVEKVSDLFGDEPFLWVANKGHGENLFEANPNAVRLPNVSHGLNGYQDHDNIVFLSALNPNPNELAYFKKLGLTEEQVKISRFYEAAYQSIMRCSLRSQGDTRPVSVIVMDRSTADYLHQLLPGSSIEKLDWVHDEHVSRMPSGRKRMYSDNADRQRAYRTRKKKSDLHKMFATRCDKLMIDNHVSAGGSSGRYDLTINTNIQNVTSWFWGEQFNSRTARFASASFLHDSVGDFIGELKRLSLTAYPIKESIPLISPACFNPDNMAEKDRATQNIEFLRGIWLDNDGGEVSPEAVPGIFRDLQMVIFNSHSSTKAKPRYRVFIPTTSVFSVETHNTIMRGIWELLHKEGFEADKESEAVDGRRFHGFDWGKRQAASLFHLPCQAADASGNLFLEYMGDGRRPLEPTEWIRKYHEEPLAESTVGDDQRSIDLGVDWERAEAAKAKWRNSPKISGHGNSEFFQLSLKLTSAGMPYDQIERELKQEAVYALNPSKRRRQIPSIISWLKQHRPK